MRSLLFTPADSDRKIAKAIASATDAVLLDLEDSVAPERKAFARGLAREALVSGGKPLWVRINPLDSGEALSDLASVMRARPVGIMLPKCAGAADLRLVGAYLAALEAREEIEEGSTRLLPIVTETGAAMFGLAGYAEVPDRLTGLAWGGEDLAADIGAAANRDRSGAYVPTYEYARTLCLLAATAAGVAAIDAVYTNFRDQAGLEAEARIAARDGFTGKLAIHPDQVEIVNKVFTPTPEDVATARRIADAFAATKSGVTSLDGRMLDRPHHRAALRLLARVPQR